MSEVVFPPESAYKDVAVEIHTQKPERYMSKYRPKVVLEEKSTKDARRTMGPAKVEVPSPEKYLKKHSKESISPSKTQCPRHTSATCTAKKPPIPTQTDNPLMGIRTKRDFIKTATMVPMKPQPTLVDSRTGHKEHLENSGLVPKYIKKKTYGEVPEYLQQRNEEQQRAQEEYNNFMKEQMVQGAMKHLSDEERRAVLEGLKKNWDKLHHEYQGLSVITDSLSKKSHKIRLEVAMKQLEKDIDLFERFKTIYIPNQ